VVLGLPAHIQACLFDLDGLLTRTATVPAAAGKEMFDGYLGERSARTGEALVRFDARDDYGARPPPTPPRRGHDVGMEPGSGAVYEDALAGVEAGRSGGLGFVIGVDRVGPAGQLKAHGARIVVKDLADLLDEP